jgi:type IV pilus modification protein PilV
MRGFTLIELLVALVILSVGLLGSSALLLGGLRDQGLALRQQAATLLVADMADRIRSNSAQVTDADLAEFASAAHAQFPFHAVETSVTSAPATGPATPAAFHVVLRWRESGDADAALETRLVVFAQSPVAG